MKRIWNKTTDRSGAKDWRKPWQGEKKSRNVDRSCRHGGNCAYCQENREFRSTRQLESTEDQIMESALTGLTVGRLKKILENLPPGFVEDGWVGKAENILRIKSPFLYPDGSLVDVFVYCNEENNGTALVRYYIEDCGNAQTLISHLGQEITQSHINLVERVMGLTYFGGAFHQDVLECYADEITAALVRVALASSAFATMVCREDKQ